MQTLKEVKGIIFKRQKYKEADLLAKIFTKDSGIVTLVVKGALRPKSKLSAATMNFLTEHTLSILVEKV